MSQPGESSQSQQTQGTEADFHKPSVSGGFRLPRHRGRTTSHRNLDVVCGNSCIRFIRCFRFPPYCTPFHCADIAPVIDSFVSEVRYWYGQHCTRGTPVIPPSRRRFDLSRNKSLRTLETAAWSINNVRDAPDFFKTALSTATPSLMLGQFAVIHHGHRRATPCPRAKSPLFPKPFHSVKAKPKPAARPTLTSKSSNPRLASSPNKLIAPRT